MDSPLGRNLHWFQPRDHGDHEQADTLGRCCTEQQLVDIEDVGTLVAFLVSDGAAGSPALSSLWMAGSM